MAQIIAEADAERRKPDPEGHLAAPQRPDRKAAAKDDARRNEEAMERNHRGGDRYAVTLSSTISVNRAGRYRMETKKSRQARAGVAGTSKAGPAATVIAP